mgnify:CR=1 FL=1
MVIKLKDIKLFEWIDLEYIRMIIDNSRREEYSVWDVILTQWDDSDGSAYIIQEWEVKVEIDGKEISTISEWNFFWEIALITDEPRVASVVAITNLVALRIDKELLHTIIKEFKNWKDIQKTLMKRIMENHKNS